MDGDDKTLISVVILTHQEEQNLPVALESLLRLGAKVFIVDSGSTDRTLEIARDFGAFVASNPWATYATQFNWALDNLPLESPWVMRLDADERLSPELVDELRRLLPTLSPDTSGLFVKRRVYFWGKWIKHGGYYPTWLLRIWRRGHARCEQRWMDEHMVVDRGQTMRLAHDIIDENHKGLSFWTDKHNRYADREVRDLEELAAMGPAASPDDQAGQRRWVKERVYARAPLFLRAGAYWSYRYFGRLGFLDGTPGLAFHFLQGFWYRFLVDAKLYEARRTRDIDGGD